MKLVQPFRLGAQTSFACLVFHDRLHGGGTFLVPAARAAGRSRLHHQDHGHPGAMAGRIAEEMTRQVTDRIEKKLEELEVARLHEERNGRRPNNGVRLSARQHQGRAMSHPTWARVRNMIADIKGDFPQGVIGPGFNDRFGDVFGNIYAFTSDGLSQRQLRDYVEDVRAKVLTVPNVGKVDILGAQDEVIFLEFSTRKIAALGLDTRTIISSLQEQNAVAPSGVFQAGPERISVRVSGEFTSEASLQAINLRVNDRFFPLTDVATITRGYADPPTTLFRFNGQPAIALAIGMKSGANLLKFGEALKEEMSKITADLPIGSASIWSRISRWSSNTRCRASRKRCLKQLSLFLASAFSALGFAPAWLLRSPSRWCSRLRLW